jgi:hypothetical protein
MGGSRVTHPDFCGVVIGPLQPEQYMLLDDFRIPIHSYTAERFLPRLLVSVDYAPSVSEVKRNRPDLIRWYRKQGFDVVRLGKKVLYVVVWGDLE